MTFVHTVAAMMGIHTHEMEYKDSAGLEIVGRNHGRLGMKKLGYSWGLGH